MKPEHIVDSMRSIMCVSCASAHSSLKMTRDHVCTTITGSDLPLSEEPGKKKHALSYCSKHGDKDIEWLCEKHEAMFCSTCKCINHRKCQVMSVSDVNSSAHGQSLEDVINSLISLKCRVAKFKSEREKNADDLVNFKTSCKDAVHRFKSSIIEKLELLEKEILAYVDNVVSTETAVIQDHVQTFDSLIPQVEAELTTADVAKTDDVASVVAAYELVKTLKMIEPTVFDLEQEAYQVHITFQPSSKLTDMITGVDHLGMLEIDRTEKVRVDPPVSDSFSTNPVYGRKPMSDMEVVSSTEMNVPSSRITGSAIMPDGRIILADCANARIILHDPDFTMTSMLALLSAPFDVAVYGDNAAVVTMPVKQQLLYIQVDTTLRADHTIPTAKQFFGVAVHDSEIYVTADDGNEFQVQVLDIRGKMTRSIGRISGFNPNITVGRGVKLYIADCADGYIRCYTNDGDVVYDVKHEGMSSPLGMVVDEDDNLLVCSTGIHVLQKDGGHRRVILSPADGLVRPKSVSYRRSDQTLIVTMANTPSCRAYTLK